MKYATLKRVSERNACAPTGVRRFTTLEVVDSGCVDTAKGYIEIHPSHIGRKVEISRHLASGVVLDVRFID